MAPKRPRARTLLEAEAIIKAAIAQADHIVALEDEEGTAARRDLRSVLREADQKLARRLSFLAKNDQGRTFSAAQARAYQTQIGVTLETVKRKGQQIAERAGKAAIGKALRNGAKTIDRLEQTYRGVALSPSLLAAMQQSHVRKGAAASLITSTATSLDRYGKRMAQQFSRIMQVGLTTGATVDQMVASLVAHGGPKGARVSLAARETAPGVVKRIQQGAFVNGLFTERRYWAERIVRTEVASAYSAAALDGLRELKKHGEPVKKKIVAVFDARTAADSIAVHGQVRELEQPFMDGAGRIYLRPPARPNDRETIIAWYDDWHETPSSEPPTESERHAAEELAAPARTDAAPPSRQEMRAHLSREEETRDLEEETKARTRLREMQLAKSATTAGIRARAAQEEEQAKKRKAAKAKRKAALARKRKKTSA